MLGTLCSSRGKYEASLSLHRRQKEIMWQILSSSRSISMLWRVLADESQVFWEKLLFERHICIWVFFRKFSNYPVSWADNLLNADVNGCRCDQMRLRWSIEVSLAQLRWDYLSDRCISQFEAAHEQAIGYGSLTWRLAWTPKTGVVHVCSGHAI